MAISDRFRPVATTLVACLKDVLPLTLGCQELTDTRRMTALELEALVAAIRREHGHKTALMHLADIASLVSGVHDLVLTESKSGPPPLAPPPSAPPFAPTVKPINSESADKRLLATSSESSTASVVTGMATGPVSADAEAKPDSSTATTKPDSSTRRAASPSSSKSEQRHVFSDFDDAGAGGQVVDVHAMSNIAFGESGTQDESKDERETAPSGAPNPAINIARINEKEKRSSNMSHMAEQSASEVASALKSSVGTDISLAESLFKRFDQDMFEHSTGALDFEQFGELVEYALEEEIDFKHLTALFDMLVASDGEIHLSDFVDFFVDFPEHGSGCKMFAVVNRSTVTAIDMSSNESTLAFGGSDCTAKLYSLANEGRKVQSRKFGTAVTSLVVSSSGDRIGVSCVGGVVHWFDVGCSDKLIHDWSHTAEVNCLSLNSNDTVLGVGCADSSARLYSLESGEQLYRFFTSASVHSICMADGTSFVFELEDGRKTARMRNVLLAASETPLAASLCRTGPAAGADAPLSIPEVTVLLNGTVVQLSNTASQSEWAALHKVLNSSRAVLLITSLVLSSFFITVLFTTGVIEQDAPDYQQLLSFVFGIEFALRYLSHKFTLHESWTFVSNPLNLVDFFCICMDILTLLLKTMDGSENAVFVAVIRFTRSIRSVRLLRVCRLAHHVSRRSKRSGTKEHDIRLDDGTQLRNIPSDRMMPRFPNEQKMTARAPTPASAQLQPTRPPPPCFKSADKKVIEPNKLNGDKSPPGGNRMAGSSDQVSDTEVFETPASSAWRRLPT